MKNVGFIRSFLVSVVALIDKRTVTCNYTASRQDIRFLVGNYACVLNSEKSDVWIVTLTGDSLRLIQNGVVKSFKNHTIL